MFGQDSSSAIEQELLLIHASCQSSSPTKPAQTCNKIKHTHPLTLIYSLIDFNVISISIFCLCSTLCYFHICTCLTFYSTWPIPIGLILHPSHLPHLLQPLLFKLSLLLLFLSVHFVQCSTIRSSHHLVILSTIVILRVFSLVVYLCVILQLGEPQYGVPIVCFDF